MAAQNKISELTRTVPQKLSSKSPGKYTVLSRQRCTVSRVGPIHVVGSNSGNIADGRWQRRASRRTGDTQSRSTGMRWKRRRRVGLSIASLPWTGATWLYSRERHRLPAFTAGHTSYRAPASDSSSRVLWADMGAGAPNLERARCERVRKASRTLLSTAPIVAAPD